MTRVEISKEELEELYLRQELTGPQIASKIGSSTSTVYKRLKKQGTKIRLPEIKRVSKENLKELYLEKKFSCRGIARLYHSNHRTVVKILKQNRIKLRSRSDEGKLIKHPMKYKISKATLKELYWKRKLSPYQIAKQYGCSAGCIFNKMNKLGIPLRSLEEGITLSIPRRSKTLAKNNIKYHKKDFDGSNLERAYLIGFRLGDLWVGKNKYGETIFVSSGTTKQEQVDLMEKLFSKYGKTSRHKLNSGCIQFSCNLNRSFDFLLPKEDNIPEWILNDGQSFVTFLAGYIDAEGHFGIDRNFAEFTISSYDVNILNFICKKLNAIGIGCHEPLLQVKAGFIDKRGVKWHGNLYRLKISKMNELLKLIEQLKPHLKHEKRLKDMLNAEANIIERNNKL